MATPSYRNKGKISYTIDEEMVLVKKLLKSVFGIFFVLTVTLLTLQFFGPALFSFLGFFSIDKWTKTEKAKVLTDPPFFADIKESTKDKKITITGFAESGSLVKLFVNGPQTAETTTDAEGKFTFNDVELLEGQNMVFAKATSIGEEESEKSNTILISLDLKKPEIKITKPVHNEEIESVDSRVQVSGTVNEDATVSVNGHMTIVDSEGNFKTILSLKSGENVIKVMATDTAGNEASSSIKVNFKKR